MMPDANLVHAAVPVAVHGFTWTAVLMGVLNVLVGGALVTWIKTRPKLREIDRTSEERLREDLMERVSGLERKMDEERARHEREVGFLRHRANNSDQCIDTLLILLENADDLPDRVKRAIASVKEMRARQKQEEALEKGAMRAGPADAAIV